MAGTLVVDTLNTSSGAFATNNGINGIAKAWVNFDGGNGNTAGTINASLNVTGVSRTAAGYYTISLAGSAVTDANYVVFNNHQYSNSSGSSDDVYGGWLQNITPTTSSYRIFTRSYSSGDIDSYKVHSAVIR
jgi:hypothetical protein